MKAPAAAGPGSHAASLAAGPGQPKSLWLLAPVWFQDPLRVLRRTSARSPEYLCPNSTGIPPGHWRTSSWSQEDPRQVNGGPPPGHRRPAPPRPLHSVTKKCSKQLDSCRNLILSAHYPQSSALLRVTRDTLAERLRRRPAKPMGSPRVGSNPTGVVLVKVASNIQTHNA